MWIANSARRIIARPGFAATVVLILGLGIGANTLVFSLVSSLLWRGTTAENPERLVRVYTSYRDGLRWGSTSYPDFQALAERDDLFQAVAAERIVTLNLATGDHNERLYGSMVSPNYFSILPARAAHGRTFGELGGDADGRAQAADATSIVLSDRLWRQRYDGDESILGEALRINGLSFTVVGVMSPDFLGTTVGFEPQFWVPFEVDALVTPGSRFLDDREARSLFVLGRLADGVMLPTLPERLDGLARDLSERFPGSNEALYFTAIPESEGAVHPMYRRGLKAVLAVLFAVVGIILMASCANVAGLLLTQVQSRSQEIAMRCSLGAGRRSIIGLLLSENLLLALFGGLVGLWFAIGGAWAVETYAPLPDLPVGIRVDIDASVLAFSMLLSVLCAVIFGLGPALHAVRTDLVSLIRNGVSGSGYRRSKLSTGLVVAQIAMSMVLLVASALLIRGLREAHRVDLGFAASHVATGAVDLDLVGYEREQRPQFYQRLLDRLQSTPGVEAAALAAQLPLELGGQQRELSTAGLDRGTQKPKLLVDVASISPGYFEVLGIDLAEGRSFATFDDADGERVVVVNRAFASQYLDTGSAVGRTLRTSDDQAYRIVGVTDNTRHTGLDSAAARTPMVFFSLLQQSRPVVKLLVRTAGAPATILDTLRQQVQAEDPALALFAAKPLDAHIDVFMALPRAVAATLTGFGFLALTLCNLGLYGTLAYRISRRAREIGVRKSVGACNADIYRMVLAEGMTITGVGAAIGMAVALFASRGLGKLLYGLSPLDLPSYLASALVLMLIAAVACLLSGRLAARIEPAQLMRAS